MVKYHLRKMNKKKTQPDTSNFSVDVVLVEPEIPQNTGSIGRTCMALGSRLHLIEPLGFSLEDRFLKRAGLDYWPQVEVTCYPDLETFFKAHSEGTYYFLSKKAKKHYHHVSFQGKTYLFFGKETLGLPEELLARYRDQCIRIPMQPGARSLNLSNAVSVVLYEAYRQNGFLGLGED
jgi:tRNA (cytidine/uridine-2'-O-)-methyltransferase